MARDPKHDVLFEPIAVGPKTFRNRFYVTPHCCGFGVEQPGAQASLRAMRAEGGWAAVNTEYCAVDVDSDDAPWVSARLIDEADVRNLSLMCERVHEHGALAGVQLAFMGPEHTGFDTRLAARGVSQIASPLFGRSCYEMSKREIRALQRAYADAARRAIRCGFDLINIPARAGFSITLQFLWPFWNRRTDEYGGSLENRVRFWRETLELVREEVDGECAVVGGFCIDSYEEPGGIRVDEDGIAVVGMLDHLVDLWDLQVGGMFDDPSTSRFFPQFWQRPFVEKIRPHTRKPIACVGRFTDPDTMAEAVATGCIDIIAAARPAIADPFLPTKIEEGRLDDIRECIGCNMCVSRFNLGGCRIVCTQNATTGEEYRRGWHPERFTRARNADLDVLVVGAGPAGMECARILGERGMRRVHLVEAQEEIGGVLRWYTHFTGLAQWGRVVSYRKAQLAKLRNVEVITGLELDAAGVRAYGAELVVIATGAHWDPDGIDLITHERIPGADASLASVLTPEQIMVEGKDVPGDRVVVYDCDGYFMGPSIAERLAEAGKRVTIVSPLTRIGDYMFYADEGHLMLRRLLELGVDLCPDHVLTSVEPGCTHGHHMLHEAVERQWPADSTVLVTQRFSNSALHHELLRNENALGVDGIQGVYRIGDCLEPRFIAECIFDGHRLAREIDSADPARPLPFIREHRVLGARDEDYDRVLTGSDVVASSSIVPGR